MSPLTLGSASQNVPEDFPQLLDLLGSRPQPAVVYYGSPGGAEAAAEPERVELSGRVLQNWAVKLIGLFRDELEDVFGEDTEPGGGPVVLIDAGPHWKAAAVALAAAALGAQVRIGTDPAESPAPSAPHTSSASPAVIITDRPGAWESSEALGDAELAALSPGLLDVSFEEATGQELPGWALDISAEVRQHPDQLLLPLEPVKLPQEESGSRGIVLVRGAAEAQEAIQGWDSWEAAVWADGVAASLFTAWAHGSAVILFDGEPGSLQWAEMLRNEGPA